MNEVITEHKLDFLSCHWDNPFNYEGWKLFKIGTCHGQWTATKDSYDILSVINEVPGNGHLNDVFEWFEFACKRDGRSLRVLEVWNKGFAKHLVTKRGFTYQSGDDLIKRFK